MNACIRAALINVVRAASVYGATVESSGSLEDGDERIESAHEILRNRIRDFLLLLHPDEDEINVIAAAACDPFSPSER